MSIDISAQVVVIGSGPAAVMAAKPMLDAGLDVLMLEAGDWTSPDFPSDSWTNFRLQSKQQWPLLGSRRGWPSVAEARSPKFGVPWVHQLVGTSGDALAFQGRDFGGTPLATVGGLSAAWGAGLGLFDHHDLADWPIDISDLLDSYRAIADRIGASGTWVDTHAPAPSTLKAHPGLHPSAMHILGRTKPRRGFTLSPALNAVLNEDKEGRRSCDQGGSCLYGCPREAIWSAAYEVRALKQHPRFRLVTGVRADRLERQHNGWNVGCHDGKRIRTRYVICAAGAIGSSRLVLPAIPGAPQRVRLLSSPAAAFALLIPSRLGAGWQRRFFGLAQLQVQQAIGANDYVFGNIFCGEGVPMRFLASMAPVSPKLALRIFRDLVPATLFGNVFFDGRHSDHTLTVLPSGRVEVSGGHASTVAGALNVAAKNLRKNFGRLGAILLPMKPVLAAPGSDLHYAGSIPMSSVAAPGKTDRWGAPFGAPDLIVVDGSVLTSLPPKGHTFTIMANAHRMASYWAGRWALASHEIMKSKS